MDLLLAEALAEGLARARQAERPPPDNFVTLRSNPEAWKRLKALCNEDNLVIAFEITNDKSEACKPIQRQFIELARQFEIPFVRVPIGPGATFDEVYRAFTIVIACAT